MTRDEPGDRPPLPSYWEYERVEDLLALQGGIEGDESALSDHEVLFIVVHQVYELWFKLAIRELVSARNLIHRDPVPDQDLSKLVACLRRVREIVDQGVNHFRLVETLTTRDFLAFRDKLLPASGFQSAQFREMEILLGLEDDDRIPFGGASGFLKALEAVDGRPSPALERVLARRRDGPSLREAVDAWLWRTPIRGSSPDTPGDAETVDGFIRDYLEAHAGEIGDVSARAARQTSDPDAMRLLEKTYAREKEQAREFLLAEDLVEATDEQRARRSRIRAALVFIETYRDLPLLAWPREVVDTLIALEQSLVIYRQRHARMVEREIGRRVGTGGSAGVDYLDRTALKYRVFGDLWAVRTILIRKDAAPPLEQGEFYGFRFDG